MKLFNIRLGSALVALVMLCAAVLAATPGPAFAASAEAQVQGLSGTDQATCFYTARQGDSLAAIAQRYGTTVQALVRMNVLANPNLIVAGVALVVPCSNGTPPSGICGTYTVRRGDNLAKIARRFGLTWQALAGVNRLVHPNLLFAGMPLQIPCSAAAPSPGDAGHWQGFSSTRYDYSVSYPADWTIQVNDSGPSGPGRDPEYVVLQPKAGGLPQVGINVLTGAAPFTGFENCEQNFVFVGLSACQIQHPAGQTPAQILWVFQRGKAHYLVAVSYQDENMLATANAVAGSLRFTQ